MTQIRVPTEQELAERLTGIDALLTSRKWERAAIVYAFTTNEGKGGRQNPTPPKMTMREFARRGFSGLTSNKSVERYRDAWVKAIGSGWASPVEPGMNVILPDHPFPPWPYGPTDAVGTAEVTVVDEPVTRMDDYRPRGPNRPEAERVLSHLESAAKAVSKLSEAFARTEIDDTMRQELVERLTELQRQTREALRQLREPASV